MSRLAYGVCVGSWDKFNQYVVPHTQDRQVFGISGQTSIAWAYNKILEAVRWHRGTVSGLVLQHDDLEITDPEVEAKLCAAFESGAGIAGVAGGMHRGDIAWWAHEPIGHVRYDSGQMIDFGAHSGPVDLLDGCLLAFSPWAIETLVFNENYEGFHGYDADISQRAADSGMPVTVVDIDVWHHTKLGFKTQQSQADWLAANEIFRKKWVEPYA